VIRMKNWNKRGIEGLPLKLMLISLMVSLALPAVIGSLDSYEASVAKASMRTSAEELAAAATEVLVAGEGNVRTVAVEISSSASRGDGRIEVGGATGISFSLGVRCVYNGAVFHTEYMSDPPVHLIAPGGEISIGPGITEVTLSCIRSDSHLVVLMEVTA